MKFRYLLFLLVAFSFSNLHSQDTTQTFLDLKPTGVEDFLNKYPKYDGRGTIILILDTGVDMGIDGLKTTPLGQTKMIDVRDFTGQGDIELFDTKLKNEQNEVVLADALGKNGTGEITITNDEHKLSIKGINKLSLKAADDKYYIGNFDENRFKNSNSLVRDLNSNGKFDDNFIVVAFKVSKGGEEYWVAYFDTNSDGSIADEKPVRSYQEKYDTFQIATSAKIAPFNFAINIFPGQKKISLFYDDGGHGTHVAGIAGGYQIGKEKHFNGVAPGSRLIALKIGHNTMSGGATVTESMKRAFLYADSLSKKLDEPCIINMSFGIGSVIEGYSDMELFLQDLLRKNPYLYVCVSNGNNGPGISTAGLPASGKYVFSSGAVLTNAVARDVYGAEIGEDIVLHFSSRGGEVPKPDVVSPGACVSTVTNWSTNDRMWGTSMASPYTTGVVSLLMSAVSQKYPGIKIPSQLLFKAIRQGAVKLKDYNYLDQGAGYINVLNAYSVLEKYIKDKEYMDYVDYTVSAYVPSMPNNRAPNLYFRNGLVINKEDSFNFFISKVNALQSDKFYRIYNLKSDCDWLLPVQKKTYLRNQQGANVSVRFDKSKMTEPGLYSGKITAYRDDNKTKFPEFELQASVIIPYEFTRSNNYSMSWENEKLMPGKHKRYFIHVPQGASAMIVKMNTPKKGYSQVIYRLFDQDGVNTYTSSLLSSNNKEVESIVSHQDLKPGVYELVVHGYFMAKELSNYNLSVEFTGVKAVGEDAIVDAKTKSIKISNSLDQVKSYQLSGRLLGYQKNFQAEFSSTDKYSYDFVIRKGENLKQFEVNTTKEDFNKLTDLSLLVYDESGKAILKDGLNYPNGVISIQNTFGNADSTTLRLVIVPAFALKAGNATINVKEITEMTTPAEFEVESNHSDQVEWYPEVEKRIRLGIVKPEYYYPSGSCPYGKLYLKSIKDERVELEIPFLIK
ncbi:MAG: S8 family serine peptidase [Bacteroidota bacterium]|nr:S8 family serine peptidase [Bacteroidota bacterium]